MTHTFYSIISKSLVFTIMGRLVVKLKYYSRHFFFLNQKLIFIYLFILFIYSFLFFFSKDYFSIFFLRLCFVMRVQMFFFLCAVLYVCGDEGGNSGYRDGKFDLSLPTRSIHAPFIC
jgi:hypothetical protein